MKDILEDTKATFGFIILALVSIIILGTLGNSLGGQSETIANQGINIIKYFVIFVLSLPPIGFFIWVISLVVKSFNENSNQLDHY